MDISKTQINKLKNRAEDFSPSGIAIHPTTYQIYILSSQGKTLSIFDSSKKLVAIIFLNKKEHLQPEGICFSPDGDLFISNEGKGISGAKLMHYNLSK